MGGAFWFEKCRMIVIEKGDGNTVKSCLCSADPEHSRNAMCGKVQCNKVDLSSIPSGAHVSIQIIEEFTCVNADFNLGPDVLDPGYVKPGSPCDKGKVKQALNVFQGVRGVFRK